MTNRGFLEATARQPQNQYRKPMLVKGKTGAAYFFWTAPVGI